MESTTPINPELQHALEEIARAARSIRALADYLERNPKHRTAIRYGLQLPILFVK